MRVSLKIKNTATYIGTFILLIYVFIALTTTIKLHTASQENKVNEIKQNIIAHQQYLHDLVDRSFVESRVLSEFTLKLHENNLQSRYLVDQLLKTSLENNPDFIGIWVVWEPDVFDSKYQSSFENECKNDSNGRFAQYVYRRGDTVIVDKCSKYEELDYYLLPKQTHRDY
jgi:methyl-accepting chemotaxis protein